MPFVERGGVDLTLLSTMFLSIGLKSWLHTILGLLMKWRKANSLWRDAEYRGKKLGYISNDIDIIEAQNIYMESLTGKQITIYPEHNDEYLQECLDNLRSKGIEISL